jgi:phosphoesterase RecJ-like protein
MVMIDEANIKSLFYTPQKAILTLHRRPDGDSVGSNLALYEVLRSLGHEVTIYSRDVISHNLNFLPNVHKIQIMNPAAINWQHFDTYWSLDMSALEMIGGEVQLPGTLQVINIDHHFTNNRWGTHSFIDSQEISTASILFKIFKKLDIRITKEIATCLMTGLTTDSAFYTAAIDSRVFKTAGELMEYGANYRDIIFNTKNQMFPEDLHFLSECLKNLYVDPKKRVAFITVPYMTWTNIGVSETKNYLLTDYIRTLKGTDFGVVIIEESPGICRLEFRSRHPTFDVSVLAVKLGGGGHKNAAGARIENTTIEEVKNNVLSLL